MAENALAPFSKELKKNGLKQTKRAFHRDADDTPVPPWEKDRIVSSCALGQIAYNLDTYGSTIRSQIDETTKYSTIPCPIANKDCGDADFLSSNNYVSDIIIHLNDMHNWNFGQIADWMDSLDF